MGKKVKNQLESWKNGLVFKFLRRAATVLSPPQIRLAIWGYRLYQLNNLMSEKSEGMTVDAALQASLNHLGDKNIKLPFSKTYLSNLERLASDMSDVSTFFLSYAKHLIDLKYGSEYERGKGLSMWIMVDTPPEGGGAAYLGTFSTQAGGTLLTYRNQYMMLNPDYIEECKAFAFNLLPANLAQLKAGIAEAKRLPPFHVLPGNATSLLFSLGQLPVTAMLIRNYVDILTAFAIAKTSGSQQLIEALSLKRETYGQAIVNTILKLDILNNHFNLIRAPEMPSWYEIHLNSQVALSSGFFYTNHKVSLLSDFLPLKHWQAVTSFKDQWVDSCLQVNQDLLNQAPTINNPVTGNNYTVDEMIQLIKDTAIKSYPTISDIVFEHDGYPAFLNRITAILDCKSTDLNFLMPPSHVLVDPCEILIKESPLFARAATEVGFAKLRDTKFLELTKERDPLPAPSRI